GPAWACLGRSSEADPAGDDGSLVRAQPAAQADLAGRDVPGAEPPERVRVDGGDALAVPDVHHGRLPGDELPHQAAVVPAAGDLERVITPSQGRSMPGDGAPSAEVVSSTSPAS